MAFAAIGIGALVPAAIMSIAAANLFTRNIYKDFLKPDATPAQETKVSKLVSLLVKVGALVFVLTMDKTVAINFQLLGGIWILQTFPALVGGLFTRWFHRWALLAGWAVGMVYGTVAAYGVASPTQKHFGGSATEIPGIGEIGYIGLTAFVLNVVVTVVLTSSCRPSKAPDGVDETSPDGLHGGRGRPGRPGRAPPATARRLRRPRAASSGPSRRHAAPAATCRDRRVPGPAHRAAASDPEARPSCADGADSPPWTSRSGRHATPTSTTPSARSPPTRTSTDGLLDFGAERPVPGALRDVAKRRGRTPNVLVALGRHGRAPGRRHLRTAPAAPWPTSPARTRPSSGCSPSRRQARGRGRGRGPRARLRRAGAGHGRLRPDSSCRPSRTMRAAHRIYERLGFVRTPERDWYPIPTWRCGRTTAL